MKEILESVRLDRWLMAARFYKTRTQAAKACEGRKVKVNGITAKPHKSIHMGDQIVVHHRGRYRNIEVMGLAQRGLPPKVARELYQEDVKQIHSEVDLDIIKMTTKMHRPKYKGRPTKKERREIDKFRDQFIK